MNKSCLKYLGSVASVIAFAYPAAAQAQAVDADILVTAQRANRTEVSAEGDLGALGNKKAADVPFQVRSYNEALILNQQPLTLGEVLENDPTVRTSYGFGNASEQFVIRGFALAGDDVGLNGLYGIAPRQLVAPELFQSVQVLNGASAFLNGAAPGGSGVGGSVNLELKHAGAVPLNRVTLGYTSDSNFGGSFDVSRRMGQGGEFGVRINGAFRSGDDSIDNEFRRTTVIGAAFDWTKENLRLTVDAAYQRVEVDHLRHKVTIGTATIPEPPKSSSNFAQPWTYTDMRDIFGVARLECDLSDNAMFYVTGGARDGSENGIYGGLTVLDATTGAANGNALYVPRTDNNEAIETGVRVKLGTAVTQEINIGGNASWQVNRNAFDFLYNEGFAGYATNLYNPVPVPLPSSTFVGGNLDHPFPVGRNRLSSVFASDTFGFWENHILLIGGLRLQDMQIKSYNYYNGGKLDTTYDANVVTPVVGLVIKPVAGLSVYANRIEGLQQGPTAPIDATLTNPGAVFAPFKSIQYEVGGKYTYGKFDVSLAWFQITLPTAYAIPLNDGSGLSSYGVYGEQRNSGVEFTASAQPIEGVRVIGGFSAINAKLRKTQGGLNDGNNAVGVPDFTANGNVEWDVPFLSGLTLTGRVTYTGAQSVNVTNTLQIPDWWRLDLGARYVLLAADKPITLRLGVDNVANARYWASAFDTFSSALLQGAPLTIKTSASIDF
jgi:iron complex outermembrane recepter protein